MWNPKSGIWLLFMFYRFCWISCDNHFPLISMPRQLLCCSFKYSLTSFCRWIWENILGNNQTIWKWEKLEKQEARMQEREYGSKKTWQWKDGWKKRRRKLICNRTCNELVNDKPLSFILCFCADIVFAWSFPLFPSSYSIICLFTFNKHCRNMENRKRAAKMRMKEEKQERMGTVND